MNKFSMAIAAAAIIGLAGTASAHHDDDHEQGQGNAFGAIGCGVGTEFESKNPGKGFQLARELTGQNPKEIADSEGEDNVGALIAENCGDPS